MIERFFLDGVNMPADDPTVYQRMKLPGSIFSDVANAAFALLDPAFMPAKVTDQAPIRPGFV
jgi:hypothetical protein